MQKETFQKSHLRIEDILQELGGISRSTFWRLRRSTNFPTGKKISDRIEIWKAEEVHEWISNRNQGGNQKPLHKHLSVLILLFFLKDFIFLKRTNKTNLLKLFYNCFCAMVLIMQNNYPLTGLFQIMEQDGFKFVSNKPNCTNAVEQKLFGNVLIFSNEAIPIEIETTDRRYTVFQTGGNLKKIGWDIPEMIHKIQEQLESFAIYLKNYEIDSQMYDQTLDPPEKRVIQQVTNNRFQLFIAKIKDSDFQWFEILLIRRSLLF